MLKDFLSVQQRGHKLFHSTVTQQVFFFQVCISALWHGLNADNRMLCMMLEGCMNTNFVTYSSCWGLDSSRHTALGLLRSQAELLQVSALPPAMLYVQTHTAHIKVGNQNANIILTDRLRNAYFLLPQITRGQAVIRMQSSQSGVSYYDEVDHFLNFPKTNFYIKKYI